MKMKNGIEVLTDHDIAGVWRTRRVNGKLYAWNPKDGYLCGMLLGVDGFTDHINGLTLDCRLENLRPLPASYRVYKNVIESDKMPPPDTEIQAPWMIPFTWPELPCWKYVRPGGKIHVLASTLDIDPF